LPVDAARHRDRGRRYLLGLVGPPATVAASMLDYDEDVAGYGELIELVRAGVATRERTLTGA
jgi:hypothetical protein